MKKLFILSVACWLSTLSSSAIDWNVATNIAQGCATKASSSRADLPSSNTTNGILYDAGWQAVAQEGRSNDWLLIDLGAEKSIADIEVIQEISRATKYDMYITTGEPTIIDGDFDGELKIDANWLATQTPVYQHSEADEPDAAIPNDKNAFRDLHHLNTPVSGRYLLMYTREYDAAYAGVYGTRVYEILVGEYTEDYSKIKTISLSDLTFNNGETVQTTVMPYTVGGNPTTSFENVNNLTLTVSDPDAAVIVDEGNGVFAITGKKFGLYTLTATAEINNENVTATATLNIQFAWNGVQNIALNKNAYASHNAREAGLSVDGNLDTRWGVGDNIQTDTWYYVDLGGLYNVTAIAPTWEAAYASHYKYYTATELGEDNEPAWEELTEIQRTLSNAARYTDTYVLPEAKEARYIKMECLKSEVWGMSFWEFQVAGEAAGQLVATEITLKTSANVLIGGQSCTLDALVKDNYNNVMDVTPSLTITEGEGELNGNVFTATTKGNVTIEAAYDKLTASVTVNVAALPEEKVIMNGATATADEKTDENNQADKAIDGNGDTTWITGQGEGAGEAEHWIQVNLDYAYNLDMVTLSWEGASPADYKVYAGTDEENLTEIFSREGQTGMVNYTDFIAADVKNAKVIKVVTTKNATGYGIKLFELEAYGTLAAGQTYTRTLANDNFGTLCLPFNATVTGATLYKVEGVLNGSFIALQETDKVEAGHPYVFLPIADELVASYEEGSLGVATGLVENGLHGTLKAINADKDEANVELTGMYVLTNNVWKFCGTGCSVSANRAYLNLGEVAVITEAAPNSLLMDIFNDNANGINTVNAATQTGRKVYTIDGARAKTDGNNLPKGLYIIDGEKVFIR